MSGNPTVPDRPLSLRRLFHLFLTVALVFLVGTAGATAQNRTLTVYYEGTEHELHVYRIWGKEPGKTLLLIGGIQGDEPGGFLSADHYADLTLTRGNLIVVPRSNFLSIVRRQRKINEDMNRKFAEDHRDNYEAKIVHILKKLIQESDCVLNLHDGSGFFAETWISPDRNPKRFGQSIIADAESYVHGPTGKTLQLGEIARSICRVINRKIEDPAHYFHFNNHRTREKNSSNKEQRKSATYYALYTLGIPAFGIETSKSLPLELKVRHHNLAINAFMGLLDIIPETPGLNLDPPVMQYAVISVNDSLPVAVENGQTLHIRPGDTVRISHIEANYDRGLSADILQYGTINDYRKKLGIDRPTRVVFRKDYTPFGSISIDFGSSRKTVAAVSVSTGSAADSAYLLFRAKINGEESIYRNGTDVNLIRGDTFELVDVITNRGNPSEMIVNFKGYVGDRRQNTGEDRGYVIDTGRDLWQRYSIDKKGLRYPVVVTLGGETIGGLTVHLEKAVLNYLILRPENRPWLCLPPGEPAMLDRLRTFQMVDINTNVKGNRGVAAFFVGPEGGRTRLRLRHPFSPADLLAMDQANGSGGGYRIDVIHGTDLIDTIPLEFTAPAASADRISLGKN